jgi:hypothetical protein
MVSRAFPHSVSTRTQDAGNPAMAFTSRYSSRLNSTHSRALPDCLYPPKGGAHSFGTIEVHCRREARERSYVRAQTTRSQRGHLVRHRPCIASSLWPMIDNTGPKYLLPHDRYIVGHIGKCGRPYVVALVQSLGSAEPASDQRGTLVDALLDKTLPLVPMDPIDDGPIVVA